MSDKFMSRKFILISVTQLLFFVCLWNGTLPADVFQSLTMVIISAYVAGNISQKALVKENKDESIL